MAKFETVSSSIDEVLSNEIESINEVSTLSKKLQAEYLSMDETAAQKVLEQYIADATNVEFSYNEDGELNFFNSKYVFGFVVTSAETKTNVGNIRYFKDRGNVVFSRNGSNKTFKLGRITPTGVQRITTVA